MRMAKTSNALILSVFAVALAGCNTTSGGAKAPAVSASKPVSSATYIAALEGGIIGKTGIRLSDSDRSRALEAEYRALETSAAGQAVSWQGDKASGSVVASAPYQVGAQNCRQYRHTVTADGKDLITRGAACRNPDGTWTPLG